MDKSWRPKGWDIVDYPVEYCEHVIAITNAFEAGADAMLEALFKLAKESPTKTFTIDSRVVNCFGT